MKYVYNNYLGELQIILINSVEVDQTTDHNKIGILGNSKGFQNVRKSEKFVGKLKNLLYQ